MTTDERLDMIENALATLADIVEQRSGCFAHDQQPVVQILGEKFQLFREHVAAQRFSGSIRIDVPDRRGTTAGNQLTL
jgi:hypothetical protein